MANLNSSQELITDAVAPEEEGVDNNIKDIENGQEKNVSEKATNNSNSKVKIINDDDEYDLMKYDGTCDKCGGRTCPEVDHIQDLIERMATSKHPLNYAYRVQYHWRHFADFNRLMQFFCPICKLHFRGAFQFTVHTVRNQTEEGFKKDGPEQITWTEEIGVQHQELLKTFILLIKEIDTNGPKVEQIRIIDQFLCSEGLRYFEIAHYQEKFAPSTLPGNYDHDDSDAMVTEYEMRLVTNDNTDAYKIEETDTKISTYSEVYRRNLDKVFCGDVARLSDLGVEDVGGVGVESDSKISPTKTSHIQRGYTCPDCNATSRSARHHISEILWDCKKKLWRHLNYFIETPGQSETILSEYDAKTTTCIYCPVCKIHVRTWRPYHMLFNHLKRHVLYPKRKPNKFVEDHFDIMQLIGDLFVERIKGDLSLESMNATLNEKFRCPNGGLYMDSANIIPQPDPHTSKRLSFSANRHQQMKRFRGESVPYGQPGPHSRGPMGMAPRSLVSGGPSNLRFRGSGPGVGTERMGSGSNFPCELCGFQAVSRGDLILHLSEALFRGNRNSVRSHLLSFSEDFIYNVACSCPSCGQKESSFANCLQHLGRFRTRNPQHQVEAEALVNQFMRCMSGAIDFNAVTRYIETSFKMGGR